MSLHANGASIGVSTEKPGRAVRAARIRRAVFLRSFLPLSLVLILAGVLACLLACVLAGTCVAGKHPDPPARSLPAGSSRSDRSVPPAPETAMEARAKCRAWAAPDAAWHHLLLAREAARDAAGPASAIANYRLAADLDPDLVEAWLGLARAGFPGDLHLSIEGLSGAARAFSRSWEAQRRFAASVFPALWLATLLTAGGILLGVGLRHIRPYRHRLYEAFHPHLDPSRAGWTASILCLIPLGLQWGLASSAAAYAGVVRSDMTRREKAAVLLAVAWFIVQPAVWRNVGEWCLPIASGDSAWLIDRAQRETPSPALDMMIRDAAERDGSPENFFARAMIERRKGQLDAARDDFARAAATEASPVAAHAEVNVGNLLLWDGDAAGAAQQYDRLLDQPAAAVEARYNLAIALSRLHRFEEADQQLAVAQKLDLDRVREAAREGDPRATGDVMDGSLAPEELWRIQRASARGTRDGSFPVPPIATWVLPGGRPAAAAVAVCVSLVLGAVAGSLLRRRLTVHACHQCGGPVCRHCVIRTVGRASCARCAEESEGMSPPDYSRLILRRVLGKSVDPAERIRSIATYLAPGLGLIARGRTIAGCALLWSFALGAVIATRAAWAFPPLPSMRSGESVLQWTGLMVAVVSWGISIAASRRVLNRRSLRRFFERDSYRVAA
jgi:tetratricopeptide (TPR) repeat protein